MWFGKSSGSPQGRPAAPASQVSAPSPTPSRRKTGRTEVYGVRVRPNFKGEMLILLASIQQERQQQSVKARRVTEGELIELMLETFKAARRNGDGQGYGIALANEVLQSVHELARHMQATPAEVVEHLVAQKMEELQVPLD